VAGVHFENDLTDRRATYKWALNGCWPDAIARRLAPDAMWRDGAIRVQHARLFFPAIANLKCALALDGDVAVTAKRIRIGGCEDSSARGSVLLMFQLTHRAHQVLWPCKSGLLL